MGSQTARHRSVPFLQRYSYRGKWSHPTREKKRLEGQLLLLNLEEGARMRNRLERRCGVRATSAPRVWRVLAGHRAWSPTPRQNRCFCPSRRFVTDVRDSWWTPPATCICSRRNLVGTAEEREGPGRGQINTCIMCTQSLCHLQSEKGSDSI